AKHVRAHKRDIRGRLDCIPHHSSDKLWPDRSEDGPSIVLATDRQKHLEGQKDLPMSTTNSGAVQRITSGSPTNRPLSGHPLQKHRLIAPSDEKRNFRRNVSKQKQGDVPGGRSVSGAPPGESAPWAPSTGTCSLRRLARASRPPWPRRTDVPGYRPAGSVRASGNGARNRVSR